MQERWGARAETLAAEHPAWQLEAHYLALGLSTWVCTLSPQRIIVGGGVLRHAPLLAAVRDKLSTFLNGYVRTPQIISGLNDYVVPPALGDDAGVLGAIALAQR
jgi:fructokinase